MKGQTVRGNASGAFDVERAWVGLVKRVIARFTRGNIAAQNTRILMPAEQDRERERARKIANKWRNRKVKHAKAAAK